MRPGLVDSSFIFCFGRQAGGGTCRLQAEDIHFLFGDMSAAPDYFRQRGNPDQGILRLALQVSLRQSLTGGRQTGWPQREWGKKISILSLMQPRARACRSSTFWSSASPCYKIFEWMADTRTEYRPIMRLGLRESDEWTGEFSMCPALDALSSVPFSAVFVISLACWHIAFVPSADCALAA